MNPAFDAGLNTINLISEDTVQENICRFSKTDILFPEEYLQKHMGVLKLWF